MRFIFFNISVIKLSIYDGRNVVTCVKIINTNIADLLEG